MTTNKMLSRIENGVGYITFNNPEKHNACLLYTSPSPRD